MTRHLSAVPAEPEAPAAPSVADTYRATADALADAARQLRHAADNLDAPADAYDARTHAALRTHALAVACMVRDLATATGKHLPDPPAVGE